MKASLFVILVIKIKRLFIILKKINENYFALIHPILIFLIIVPALQRQVLNFFKIYFFYYKKDGDIYITGGGGTNLTLKFNF